MSDRKKKLLVGFSDIYFAPFDISAGTFGTPVQILNGRGIESELEYETTSDWADDMIILTSSYFKGGSGNVKFLGLSAEEYKTLFGNKKVKGGYVVSEDDIAPSGAFIFSRKKKGSTHKRLTVIYNATCTPSKEAAEAIIEGKAEPVEVEVNFSVGSYEHTSGEKLILFSIDTDDTTVDSAQVTSWFTEVQFPIDIPPAQV